jgi:hypothetical protein
LQSLALRRSRTPSPNAVAFFPRPVSPMLKDGVGRLPGGHTAWAPGDGRFGCLVGGHRPGARALGDTPRRGLSASTAACDARAAALLRPSDGERCARPALGWPRPRRLGGVRRGRPGACRRRGKGAGTRARQRWPIASAYRSAGRGFQQLSAPASCLWFSCPPKRRTFRAYAIELRNLGIPPGKPGKRRPRSGDHK